MPCCKKGEVIRLISKQDNDSGCGICGMKLHLLPGPQQDQITFHNHRVVHQRCYDLVMKLEIREDDGCVYELNSDVVEGFL